MCGIDRAHRVTSGTTVGELESLFIASRGGFYWVLGGSGGYLAIFGVKEGSMGKNNVWNR